MSVINNNLKKSICKIEILDNNKVKSSFTGFYFAPQLILTVGHPFINSEIFSEEKRNTENQSQSVIKIYIENDFVSYAIVVEQRYEIEKPKEVIDFAILKVDKQNESFLKLGSATYAKKDCILLGYPSDTLMNDPRFLPVRILGQIRDNFVQISVDGNQEVPANGMSGSPCIINGEKQVLAIQTHFDPKQKVLFGITIESIKKISKYFNKHLVYRHENIYNNLFDNGHVIRIKNNTNSQINKRWSLLISDENLEDINYQLLPQWNIKLINKVNEIIQDLLKHPNFISENELTYYEIVKDLIKDGVNPLMYALDESPYNNNHLRVVIDPTNYFINLDSKWSTFSKDSISHSISIVANFNECQNRIIKNPNFDLTYEIGMSKEVGNIKYFVDCVINILVDITIDRIIFYKYNIFPLLFIESNLGLNFSKMKVAFAKQEMRKSYGLDFSEIDINYISLASLTRISLNHMDISTNMLKNILNKFIEFLLANYFDDRKFVIKITKSTIKAHERGLKEETLRRIFGTYKIGATKAFEVSKYYELNSISQFISIVNIC
ncbi:hypothetical protein GCM10011514_35810 [Emticicia aquatilis]|uniref:Serine protease n=1 Tax=Emticicia aquatilis TaxID=1537369 RepID=A0A916YZV1_9BACT|nr:trypsin-like peptidase domain-containing protein [Emticicia aquatilis]GGD68530.1 hypothetical protein GCM10011514_35810 [Emticicia aquatilis]